MKQFPEWRPDDSPFKNPGLLTCLNVLPGDDDYLPLPSPVEITNADIGTIAIGAIAVRDVSVDAKTYNFVGTQSSLFSVTHSVTDVSRASGYNGTTSDRWEFAQVGNEIIATNFQDEMQTYTIGTSSIFANLGGSPPKARHVAKIGDFLVVGNLNDGDYYPQRIRWAGIGSTTSWTVSATTQADYQDLNNEYGWIQGIVSGDFGGLIFQEYGIIRMTYVGSPLIFQFDIVKSANGALAPGGICNLGDMVAYLGQDGFYLFDGQTSINIGTDRVNQWFFVDMDPAYTTTISCSLYPQQSIVAWSYRSMNASLAMNDKIIFYNYAKEASKRWTVANINNSLAYLSLTLGYTLDELDNFPPGSQTLETLPYSLDSKQYVGNEKLIGIINGNNFVATLTGTPLDATIETGDIQFYPGSRAQINKIRPYVDSSLSTNGSSKVTTQMRIGHRETLEQTVTYTSAINLTSSGYATARASGRYHRIKLTTTGTFNKIQGYDISSIKKEGRR